MLHARADYQRIQDPASNPELIQAYNDAMNLVARYDSTEDYSSDSYHAAMRVLAKLTRALSPTLGLLIDAKGVYMPSNPIGADEPVFLLRGQDVYAPDTIRRWSSLTFDRGNGNEEMSQLATAHAEAMETWQVRAGRCKVADLPEQSMARTAAESPT